MTEVGYRHYADLKEHVAAVAATIGATAAARQFGVTVDFARYHLRKLLVPGLHSGDWGGARNMCFDDLDQLWFDVSAESSCVLKPLRSYSLDCLHLQIVLLAEIRWNPLRTLNELATVMSECGWVVTRDFVHGRLKFHNFSLKKAKRKHVLKFTRQNLLYTAHYLVFVRGIVDWRRLKFVDESSFESRCKHSAALCASSHCGILCSAHQDAWLG